MMSRVHRLPMFQSSLKSVLFLGVFCLMSLTACEDTKFSDPAFQADLNYELWLAEAFRASYNANGDLVITATNAIETVELTLASDNVGTIDLGPDYQSEAKFIDGFGSVFSTAVEPDEEVSIYRDLGVVDITSRNTARNTITGNFYFTAYDEEGRNPVGLSNGIFFQIAISATE